MMIPSGIIFPSECPLLRRGDKGNDVILLQAALVINGYSLEIDGIFGLETEMMLKDFQSDHKLEADGICGPLTWETL